MNDVDSPLMIAPEDQLNPPHQLIISKRRRARTVDVEGQGSDEDILDDVSISSIDDEEADDWAPRRRSSMERHRQKLLSSRCVRGALALCVYALLVLHPSSTDRLLTTGVSTEPTKTAADNSTSTKSARSLEETKKSLRMAALPKFHNPPGTTVTADTAATKQKNKKKVQFHSTIPPEAVKGVTHANGTTTHWHKIPPTIYHKKQRPILSHAHSYQLHHAPFVFDREDAASAFFSADGASSTSWSFSSCLIWLSLIVLLADTTYKEWQHYRFQQLTSSPSLSRRQRRYRRSPSPEPRRRLESYG